MNQHPPLDQEAFVDEGIVMGDREAWAPDPYPGTRKQKIRQRVLDGMHTTLVETDQVNKNTGERRCVTKQYRARKNSDPPTYRGDIFEDYLDMTETHNQPGMPPKFARVDTVNAGVIQQPANPFAKAPGESEESYRARIAQLAAKAQTILQSSGGAITGAIHMPTPVDERSPLEPDEAISEQFTPQVVPAPAPAPIQVASVKEKLASMSIENIRKWAKDEKVDLKGAQSKGEAIKAFLEDPRFK